ncbi:hypothetical protein D3C81_2153290 [compost metagenome]
MQDSGQGFNKIAYRLDGLRFFGADLDDRYSQENGKDQKGNYLTGCGLIDGVGGYQVQYDL